MATRLDLDSLPGFRVTWETVTPESAEVGDLAESGFMRSAPFGAYRGDGPPMAEPPDRFRLREALEAMAEDLDSLAGLEAVEANDSDAARARWVSAIWNVPGGSETRSIHIPETVTAASRARIVRATRAALIGG